MYGFSNNNKLNFIKKINNINNIIIFTCENVDNIFYPFDIFYDKNNSINNKTYYERIQYL